MATSAGSYGSMLFHFPEASHASGTHQPSLSLPPVRLSSRCSVLSNNDAPTGAARIVLEATLPSDWEGWSGGSGSSGGGLSGKRSAAAQPAQRQQKVGGLGAAASGAGCSRIEVCCGQAQHAPATHHALKVRTPAYPHSFPRPSPCSGRTALCPFSALSNLACSACPAWLWSPLKACWPTAAPCLSMHLLHLEIGEGSSHRAPPAQCRRPLPASCRCPCTRPPRCCRPAAAAHPALLTWCKLAGCGRQCRLPRWRRTWRPRCLSTAAARLQLSTKLSGRLPCCSSSRPAWRLQAA